MTTRQKWIGAVAVAVSNAGITLREGIARPKLPKDVSRDANEWLEVVGHEVLVSDEGVVTMDRGKCDRCHHVASFLVCFYCKACICTGNNLNNEPARPCITPHASEFFDKQRAPFLCMHSDCRKLEKWLAGDEAKQLGIGLRQFWTDYPVESIANIFGNPTAISGRPRGAGTINENPKIRFVGLREMAGVDKAITRVQSKGFEAEMTKAKKEEEYLELETVPTFVTTLLEPLKWLLKTHATDQVNTFGFLQTVVGHQIETYNVTPKYFDLELIAPAKRQTPKGIHEGVHYETTAYVVPNAEHMKAFNPVELQDVDSLFIIVDVHSARSKTCFPEPNEKTENTGLIQLGNHFVSLPCFLRWTMVPLFPLINPKPKPTPKPKKSTSKGKKTARKDLSSSETAEKESSGGEEEDEEEDQRMIDIVGHAKEKFKLHASERRLTEEMENAVEGHVRVMDRDKVIIILMSMCGYTNQRGYARLRRDLSCPEIAAGEISHYIVPGQLDYWVGDLLQPIAQTVMRHLGGGEDLRSVFRDVFRREWIKLESLFLISHRDSRSEPNEGQPDMLWMVALQGASRANTVSPTERMVLEKIGVFCPGERGGWAHPQSVSQSGSGWRVVCKNVECEKRGELREVKKRGWLTLEETISESPLTLNQESSLEEDYVVETSYTTFPLQVARTNESTPTGIESKHFGIELQFHRIGHGQDGGRLREEVVRKQRESSKEGAGEPDEQEGGRGGKKRKK